MTEETTNVTNQLGQVKRYSQMGGEYWTGREIQPLLAYSNWQNFEKVIKKAKMSCESAGIPPENHFIEASNMVSIGSGAVRPEADYYLTRFACYLIAMNGDPKKPEIATAQRYFAVQTRRMEIQDKLMDERGRIELRDRLREANRNLSGAAGDAGVEEFGIFHDAGYRGLYGGMGASEIKSYKGIPQKDQLLDRAGRTELAANEFRITQTEETLIRERIQGEETAINTHRDVGKKVRDTITEIGGAMPEELPPEPHIKNLIKQHGQTTKKIGEDKKADK